MEGKRTGDWREVRVQFDAREPHAPRGNRDKYARWASGFGIALRLWWERLSAEIARALRLERERRVPFNWLPLAVAAGIVAFFAADSDPSPWGPPAALCLCLAGAIFLRQHRLGAVLLVAAAVALGMSVAMVRTVQVASPILDRVRITTVQGTVLSVDERARDMRVVIEVSALEGVAPGRVPKRVRLTARRQSLHAGQPISVLARLQPPPQAARPGGYDFARDAYFRGLGAVGNALRPFDITGAEAPAGARLRWLSAIDRARNALTARISDSIGGQPGALAAALVTGKRGLISADTDTVLRAAGLYHIVSISGLHMVLAAGAFFWLSRALLALHPTLALRWPIRKLAAVIAMVGATAYCVFSGAEVATVRALVMTLIMLGAVLLDRHALSMRNLAMAALLIMLLEPEAVIGPSFQMSFGAVAGLIAYAEWMRRRARHTDLPRSGWPTADGSNSRMTGSDGPGALVAGASGGPPRLLRTAVLAMGALLATTLTATIATSPYGAYHFNTIYPFGLVGNALALPFVSIGIMPAAVLGAALYPLGLDGPAWWVMGLAAQVVVLISQAIAGLDSAHGVLPAFGPQALLLFTWALYTATLLTTWLRWLALPIGMLAIGLALANPRPDLLIDREGRSAAIRGSDNALQLLGRPGRFVAEQWLRADGDARASGDPTLRVGTNCDRSGCMGRLKDGQAVTISLTHAAVVTDCARASIVITPLRWDGACEALIADRVVLEGHGALAVFIKRDGITTLSARNPASPRAWHRTAPIMASTPRAPSQSPPTRPARDD